MVQQNIIRRLLRYINGFRVTILHHNRCAWRRDGVRNSLRNTDKKINNRKLVKGVPVFS